MVKGLLSEHELLVFIQFLWSLHCQVQLLRRTPHLSMWTSSRRVQDCLPEQDFELISIMTIYALSSSEAIIFTLDAPKNSITRHALWQIEAWQKKPQLGFCQPRVYGISRLQIRIRHSSLWLNVISQHDQAISQAKRSHRIVTRTGRVTKTKALFSTGLKVESRLTRALLCNKDNRRDDGYHLVVQA